MINPKDKGAYAAFRETSARLGSDPLLIQAAGGNTSMKDGEVLWVKASGKWLMDAQTSDIMVPLDLEGLGSALSERRLTESKIGRFILGDTKARASVEAPFHAAFNAKYVLHAHSVPVIAKAVLEDGERRLAASLKGIDWGFVPYIKPGVPLTYAMMDRGALNHEVVILGNHGLIVAHDDLNYAEGLLRGVHNRLLESNTVGGIEATDSSDPITTGPKYRRFTVPGCTKLACDPVWQKVVTTGAIAPDFLVFLGSKIPIVDLGPDLETELASLAQQPLPFASVVIVRGKGVLIREDAMNGTEDLFQGLCAVLLEMEAAEWPDIRYFSRAEEYELLNWDAEKYRQSMNAGGNDA